MNKPIGYDEGLCEEYLEMNETARVGREKSEENSRILSWFETYSTTLKHALEESYDGHGDNDDQGSSCKSALSEFPTDSKDKK